MSIHKIGTDLVRPSGSRSLERGSCTGKQPEEEELRRVERTDSVEISAEGRELAARMLRDGEASSESRTEMIRSRIETGFYNNRAVAEKVAERIQASGDLDILV